MRGGARKGANTAARRAVGRIAVAPFGRGWRPLACALMALAIPASAMAQSGVGSPFELVFWQSIAASDDAAQYRAYLDQYPNGIFAALARRKIATLESRGAASPAQTPAPAQPASIPAPADNGATAPHVEAPSVATPSVAASVVNVPAVNVPAVSGSTVSGPSVSGPAISAPTVTPPVATAPVTSVVMANATPAPPASAVNPPEPIPEPTPAPAASGASLADQLAQLGMSQGQTQAPAPTAATGATSVPPRPILAEVPAVDFPDHFCSASARNSFYDETYKPAKDVSDQNNQAAINHMRALQAAYDAFGQHGDTDGQNRISAESHAYQPVAAQAFQTSTAYADMFQRLMAVPIADCGAARGGQ